MPDLFPVGDTPVIVDAKQDTPVYRDSYLFDFIKGDFVKDGANRVVRCDPVEAWRQWCVMAVMTQRYAFLSYSGNYGAELEESRHLANRGAVESYLRKSIGETLLADPYHRTRLVNNFRFQWQDETLTVAFDVYSRNKQVQRIEINKLFEIGG